MKSRANLPLIEERIELVKSLIAKRLPRSEIVKKLKKQCKIQDRQAANYISKAYDEWKNAGEQDRKQRRLEQREALLDLYQEARGKNEYAVCVQIEKLLSKIDGTEFLEKGHIQEPLKLIIQDYRAD